MRRILLSALAVLSLAFVAHADNVVTIGSRTAVGATDVLDWNQLGPAGTVLTTPQTVTTFLGSSAEVGNIDGASFEAQTGATWGGDFFGSEALVFNGDAGDPFLLELANPVGAFGFNIDPLTPGAFIVQITALDCSFNTLSSQGFFGVSNTNGNGTGLFVGLGDTSGANICGIGIQTLDTGGTNGFAIDEVALNGAPYNTPEPGSLLLFGSGLVGLAGIRRRKVSA